MAVSWARPSAPAACFLIPLFLTLGPMCLDPSHATRLFIAGSSTDKQSLDGTTQDFQRTSSPWPAKDSRPGSSSDKQSLAGTTRDLPLSQGEGWTGTLSNLLLADSLNSSVSSQLSRATATSFWYLSIKKVPMVAKKPTKGSVVGCSDRSLTLGGCSSYIVGFEDLAGPQFNWLGDTVVQTRAGKSMCQTTAYCGNIQCIRGTNQGRPVGFLYATAVLCLAKGSKSRKAISAVGGSTKCLMGKRNPNNDKCRHMSKCPKGMAMVGCSCPPPTLVQGSSQVRPVLIGRPAMMPGEAGEMCLCMWYNKDPVSKAAEATHKYSAVANCVPASHRFQSIGSVVRTVTKTSRSASAVSMSVACAKGKQALSCSCVSASTNLLGERTVQASGKSPAQCVCTFATYTASKTKPVTVTASVSVTCGGP